MSRTIVRLKIISPARTPEEINTLVGIECEKSWRIGDLRGKSAIKEKKHGWILNSDMAESASLEAHAEALLDRLNPCAIGIEALSRESDTVVEFSCVIYSKETPALNFGRDVIQKISHLGAALDIDLYML